MTQKELHWTTDDTKAVEKYIQDIENGRSDIVFVDKTNIEKLLD